MPDDKYRTAVDAAAIYSETDLRGTITHINDQFCAISGYAKEELIGANHRLLNSGQHPPEFLPAQTIKIDKSFVRDILHDKDDLALSEAIINLSRTFEREVIAEGVETELQENMLLGMGCYLAQGYGIAAPMPANEVEDWAAGYEMMNR